MASLFDASLCWDDLRWLINFTTLPVNAFAFALCETLVQVLVKGIVRADDALRAVEVGAAGIVVSNHGGRQLDHCIASVRQSPIIICAFHSFPHRWMLFQKW